MLESSNVTEEIRVLFLVVVLLLVVNTIYFLYSNFSRSVNGNLATAPNQPGQGGNISEAAGNEMQKVLVSLVRENSALAERVRELERWNDEQKMEIFHLRYQLNIPTNPSPFRVVLRELMEKTLGEEDVQELLFNMNYKREDLPSQISVDRLILELIQQAERRKDIPALLQLLKQMRPKTEWPVIPPAYLK